ncbi:hypothetical protein LTR09_005104 [Extremus antarcticus]|uniref:RNase III domain-containing protein n=1 Tax=Extremus antarcticus TaxID=702011 RepID=A0AAJ0DPL2_9PEZI|nr:hypothetical protein LTR09_005104 [Extremus antarcticus]
MADARIDAALAIVAVPLDRRLVWEALQAAGAVNDFIHGRLLPEGNKFLAGVGDRVLSLVITETARQDGVTIGETNIRLQNLAKNERLATLCDSTGLTRLVKLSNAAVYAGAGVGTRTKSATIEAVIGAAYLHAGIDCAVQVMRNLTVI